MEKDRAWLESRVNSPSYSCAILRKSRIDQVIENPRQADIKEMDAILTLLGAIYKLMVLNHERFCQKSSENTKEYTWGFHHEDWQRAYAIIAFVKGRRTKTIEVPERGPMQYIGVRGKIENAEIYGFATLEILSTVEGLEDGSYLGAAVDSAKEMALLDPEHDKEAMRKLAERGTNEQIARALDAIDSVRKKPQSMRESLIENDDGALEDIISEETVNTLHAIAPGIDLSRALLSTVPKAQQREKITSKEREALANLFRENLRIYTPPSPASNSSDGNRYQELQTITTAGDVSGLADESGTISAGQHVDTEFESLRNMRALLGENVPENQDLEEICKLRGIDIDTLAVNSHNPSVTAKAPQIPGLSFTPCTASMNSGWPKGHQQLFIEAAISLSALANTCA